MSGRGLFLVLMVGAVAAVAFVLSRSVPETPDGAAARYRGMGAPPATAGAATTPGTSAPRPSTTSPLPPSTALPPILPATGNAPPPGVTPPATVPGPTPTGPGGVAAPGTPPGKPTVLRPGDSTGAAKDADALTPWVDRAAESSGAPKRTDEYVVGPAPESVFTVAQRMFGETTRWRDVLEANRGVIRDQDAIPVGTRLKIPPPKRRGAPAAPRLAGGVD